MTRFETDKFLKDLGISTDSVSWIIEADGNGQLGFIWDTNPPTKVDKNYLIKEVRILGSRA